MRYTFLLSVLVILSGCSSIMSQGKGEATSHLELGKRYRSERNFEAAAREFKRSIELDGTSADAHYRLANWSDEKRAEIKKTIDNLLAERERQDKLDKDFIQFIQWAYHQIYTKDSIEEIFDFKKYEKYIVNDEEENSAVSDA